ncbi:MAG: hypothetical protein IPJ77_07955 [Planctomycetes bacterium]|nr:hypothetical protein [Planctomycetota bacterium]
MFGAPATFFLPGTPPFQAFVKRAYELPELRDVLRAVADEPASAGARAEPLLWRPTRRAGPALGRAMPQSVLEARMQRLKHELAFERASVAARAWWSRYEARHQKAVQGLVQLLESLKEEAGNLDDLHGAHRITCRDEPRVLANYVRYQRSVRDVDALDQLALGWPPEPDETRGADGAGPGAHDAPPGGDGPNGRPKGPRRNPPQDGASGASGSKQG